MSRIDLLPDMAHKSAIPIIPAVDRGPSGTAPVNSRRPDDSLPKKTLTTAGDDVAKQTAVGNFV